MKSSVRTVVILTFVSVFGLCFLFAPAVRALGLPAPSVLVNVAIALIVAGVVGAIVGNVESYLRPQVPILRITVPYKIPRED